MKALKFLGIALLACGLMFTSCKKDNPKPTDNTSETPGGGGETPGGGGGETPANGATISFNGGSWVAANVEGVDRTSDDYITFYIEKTSGCSNNQSDVFLQGFLESVVCSNATYESTGGDVMHYRDPNFTYTDNDNALGQGAGQVFWGWSVATSTFVENITAVDLNALTMSGNFSEQVYSLEDYVANGLQVPSNTYPCTGTLNNMSWSWVSKKAADTKKIMPVIAVK